MPAMRLVQSYRSDPVVSPLTRWVHRAPPGRYWAQTPRDELSPPLPSFELGRGYPVWEIAHRGHVLCFASREEIAHAIHVLGQRVLPRPSDLAPGYGHANQHWLSRLHKAWTPWKLRQRLVLALSAGL